MNFENKSRNFVWKKLDIFAGKDVLFYGIK